MNISEEKMLALLGSLRELTPNDSRWEWKMLNNTLILSVMSSIELKDSYSGDITVMAKDEFWTPCLHVSNEVRMLSPYQTVIEVFKALLEKYNKLPYIYVGSVRKEVKQVRQLVEYIRFSENPNHEIRDNQSYRILFNELRVRDDEEGLDDENGSVYVDGFNILNALAKSPNSKQQEQIIKELPVISFTETSLSKGRVTIKTKKGSYFSSPGSYQHDGGILTIFADKSNLPARLKTAVLNQSITIPNGDEPLVI